MEKVSRLKAVLQQENRTLLAVVNENRLNDFIDSTILKYEQLSNEADMFKLIGETYLNWSVSVASVYITLKEDFNVNPDQALDAVNRIFKNTVDELLNQLSFIQLAFHYSYNPAFLKWIALNALIKDQPLKIYDDMKEHDLEKGLNESISRSNIINYFNYYQVGELIYVAKMIDTIIEKYIEENFNEEKPKVVYKI